MGTGNAMPSVSVVVVSFNTRDLSLRCLASLPDSVQAIVVDNASSDGSADAVAGAFPRATILRNPENRGFGAANNQGMDAATGELVLFLNSDAYATPGAIERLTEVFDDPAVIAAGGKLVGPDGRLQQSSANRLTLWAVICEQLYLEKLFPRSRIFAPYWNSWRHKATAEVAQVMGACLMMRKDAARFDERYFLYCEDTDLCLRLSRLGRILYVPEAVFVHDLGSSSSARWEAVARYNRGKELYFAIHCGRWASALCWVLDRVGALARLAVWGMVTLATLGRHTPSHDRVRLFWKVLTAPPSGPPIPTRRHE